MNYITALSSLSTFIDIQGYSLNLTQFILLSSNDITKTQPLTSFFNNSNRFSPVSGSFYTNYSIENSNKITVNLNGLPYLGVYDLVAVNNAGYLKLSDINYLINYSDYQQQLTPTPTPTPTITPTISITPSITPTISITPTLTQTPTITPTPTVSITPTTNQFPGISASNTYIAINYGNQNIFLFGTNTVVQRNYGYDPDVVWDNTSVNGNNNRIALLDWNFLTPGSWSFSLENQSFGVDGYAWKNNSTDSSIIPTGGWFGYVPFGSTLQAGSATLILSATSLPVTLTPTPTPTITPTPSITPYLYDRASKASIQDSYNLLKNISNPVKNYTNFSLLCTLGYNNFCNDWSGVRREWNPNFWGYAYRNTLNFSGVSHNTELNATLITPQHFIGNSHFAPSLSCCFYDHNTGEAVHIKIQDYRTFGEDSYVGKLASPVPAASAIKIYKIAAATTDISVQGNQFPLFYMGGKAFTTNDDCFHGGCVGSTKNNPFSPDLPRSYIDTYFTSLTTVSAAFAGKDFASNGAVGGESSNPMFILLNNDLHLYGTFFYPDNGPWWGSQSILANVSAAIIQMGSEGYSLSAVYLDQYVPPTATSTPTLTPTITPTNTVTPSSTPTNTSTISITPSITPTLTLTPTISITPTRTPTVTPTKTATPTPTLTPTITPTNTVTPSSTPTNTSTISITPSITPTLTLTPTISITPTKTSTVTPTKTATPTVTPTVTPSPAVGSNCVGYTNNLGGTAGEVYDAAGVSFLSDLYQDTISFNNADPGGTPSSMLIYFGSNLRSYVDFASGRTGQAFCYKVVGVAELKSGIFTNGAVNL